MNSRMALPAPSAAAQSALQAKHPGWPQGMIAVVGPPGAGKSTVVRALALHGNATVFRLREAIRAYPDVLSGLPPSADQLGWVSDEAVARVLDAAFLENRFPGGSGPILLDNFPGNALQLRHLARIASALGRTMAILELRADTAVLAARVAGRQVCPGCGADPHAPAEPDASDPTRCARCRGALQRRDTDTPQLHARRLARYQRNRPEIVTVAGRLFIPHLVVHAGHPTPVVSRLARHLFTILTDPASAHRATSDPGRRP